VLLLLLVGGGLLGGGGELVESVADSWLGDVGVGQGLSEGSESASSDDAGGLDVSGGGLHDSGAGDLHWLLDVLHWLLDVLDGLLLDVLDWLLLHDLDGLLLLLLDDWLVHDLSLDGLVLDSLLDSLLRNVLDVLVVVNLRNVLGLVLDSVVVGHLLLSGDVLGVDDGLVLDLNSLVGNVLNSALSLDALSDSGGNQSGDGALLSGNLLLLDNLDGLLLDARLDQVGVLHVLGLVVDGLHVGGGSGQVLSSLLFAGG